MSCVVVRKEGERVSGVRGEMGAAAAGDGEEVGPLRGALRLASAAGEGGDGAGTAVA